MIKIYLSSLLIFIGLASTSQSLRRPLAAPYIGLGAYSLHHVDAFSFTSNQAALAQIKSPSIGVYGEQRFLLAETNMYSAVVVMPTANGNFGFQADYLALRITMNLN